MLAGDVDGRIVPHANGESPVGAVLILGHQEHQRPRDGARSVGDVGWSRGEGFYRVRMVLVAEPAEELDVGITREVATDSGRERQGKRGLARVEAFPGGWVDGRGETHRGEQRLDGREVSG